MSVGQYMLGLEVFARMSEKNTQIATTNCHSGPNMVKPLITARRIKGRKKRYMHYEIALLTSLSIHFSSIYAVKEVLSYEERNCFRILSNNITQDIKNA